ncbi:ABC transporter permease [Anaerocolumna aminovalerica]|nr:ABC transporter permease [Anaerocolumna aminovalerica]
MMNRNIEKQFQILRTLLAVAIAIAVAFTIICFISDNPIETIKSFVLGPLTSKRKIGNIITNLTPMLFVGAGVCLIFSANQTNMAVEGGFFVGAMLASVVATCVKLPTGIHVIACLIAGGIAGAMACLIPAFLFVKFNAKPVVSSIMVNNMCLFVALFVINHLIRDPAAGFLASYKFAKTSRIGEMIPGTGIHYGILIGITVLIITFLYLNKSKAGYEIRTVGRNVEFARYSGINVNSVIIKAQLLGGILAGMGGAVEVLGMYKRFQYQSLTNHGFDGIMIGIMANYNPKMLPLAALFLAYIRAGADSMQRTSDVPVELANIMIAVIVIMIVAEKFLYKMKHKRIVAAAQKKLEEKEAA